MRVFLFSSSTYCGLIGLDSRPLPLSIHSAKISLQIPSVSGGMPPFKDPTHRGSAPVDQGLQGSNMEPVNDHRYFFELKK